MITAFGGCDEYVAKWVAAHIDGCPGFDLEKAKTIGVLDQFSPRQPGRLICGVVYSEYRGHSIEATIASTDPRWASRRVLFYFFAYPFNELGVERLQTTVAKKNKQARKFNERLGFKYEGTGRKAWPDGSHACQYAMMKNECRWIKGRNADVERRIKRANAS